MGDEKEALDFTYPIPPEGVSNAVAHRMYGENLWPRTLPGFRPAIESYLDEMPLGELVTHLSEAIDRKKKSRSWLLEAVSCLCVFSLSNPHSA